jgi:hypothetical protein
MRDISTIMSICGSGKCGLSGASSDRGGISSMAFVPKIPDVLFPHGHVPRVVGVGLRTVAELVAPQCDLRRRDDREVRGRAQRPTIHPQLAQQSANAEQHASRVGAQHQYSRHGGAGAADGKPKAFPAGSGNRRCIPQRRRRPLLRGRERADRNDRYRFSRPGGGNRQPDVGTFANLLDQDAHGSALLYVQVCRRDDRGALEIDQGRGIGLSLTPCWCPACCGFSNPQRAQGECQQAQRTRAHERTHR